MVGNDEFDTFQVGGTSKQSHTWLNVQDNENPLLSIYIQMDKQRVIISTTEITLTFWLIGVGGIASSLMGSFSALARVSSRYIFVTEVLSKLYLC